MASILAIDAGTTGVTALVVDEDGAVASKGYREFPQSFPRPGWVEHDPDHWWRAMLAAAGGLAFGTVDSYLVARLTGGSVHATDRTNASRTMLYDIHRLDWDDELLERLRIPRAVLPQVLPSAHRFGLTDPERFVQARTP